MWTLQMVGRDFSLSAAVSALHPDRGELCRYLCAFRHRPFGEHVQIDLDAVRDDSPKLSDAQVDDADSGRVIFPGDPDAVLQ